MNANVTLLLSDLDTDKAIEEAVSYLSKSQMITYIYFSKFF